MKNLEKIKRNIYIKLILLEIAVVYLMKILVPVLANYPPSSENNAFQASVEPLSHNMQYLILGSFGVILYAVFITHLMKDVFKYIKKDKKLVTFKEIQTVRKACFSFPRKILIVQLIVILVVLSIFFVSMRLNLFLILKFVLIYFSFFIVTSIVSNVLIKNDMDVILNSTYEINNSYTIETKTSKFSNELIHNILPFFIVVIITISLFGYTETSEAIGEQCYYYYQVQLDNAKLNYLSMEDLQKELGKISLKSPNDYYFIIYGDGENDYKLSSEDGYLSNFFINYAKMKNEELNGRVYEYYGVDEQGYCQKITLNDGTECYIGFKYSVTSKELITYFVSIASIAIIFYIIILILWSRNISKTIREVSDSLKAIAEQKDLSNIGVLPITSNDEIALLTDSFNKIQQTSKNNMDRIKSTQSRLVEQERLASLGQMIGGIAHNLKTPIMSISGIAEGLHDLTVELDNSIGNPVVTNEDFHEIAKDYFNWIEKIKEYTEYMSDIITAVKGQTVTLVNDMESSFTISELLKRVNILMKHELKNAIVYLNITVNMDENTVITGDVNSLVQIINNIISNSIQAYEGKPEQTIELNVSADENNAIISITDHASGIPKKIKNKLFKEMVTTKGKNGTGLGLYMSYSTIKAHFNGDMTFESEEGQGTTFTITIPI